ncbi:Oidioi.mRNA.OKI2018_I69.chr1.g1155.t1.cds [Oikopleura dioica]|uniref:Oidioi.mRNA.OKI2018_I69.chr1.g1155.t1.cds n=1 Tax=Oikopleura dioica TaxID=34765 RepID=A0ABN7SQU7_OIKDI|nr:Oidioi.mRNA.OKI2018_I69.chr1.g1155.t1.cds [Oikopleura dioica]
MSLLLRMSTWSAIQAVSRNTTVKEFVENRAQESEQSQGISTMSNDAGFYAQFRSLSIQMTTPPTTLSLS